MFIMRFFTRIVNQMSIKYKLFFILLLISLIPLTLVSYSSKHYIYQASSEYSADISTQYTSFVSSEISNYLQSIQQSFEGLFSDVSFQRFLITSNEQLAQQASDIIQFRPIITNSLQFHPEILGITYIDTLQKTYFQSNQKTFDASFSFAADTFYSRVYHITSSTLLPPHPMNYALYAKDEVLSYVWPIVNLNSGEIQSWIIIEIQADYIMEMLGNDSSNIGQLALYHEPTDQMYSHQEIPEEVTASFALELAKQEQRNTHFILDVNGASYDATYATLPQSEWLLVWTASMKSIDNSALKATIITVLIAIISFIVALFIAFPMMNRTIKPLYHLKQGMQSLGRGVYTPIKMTDRQDEIGHLIGSYNQTLNKLATMEQEVLEASLKEKEHEILQLQAQINPHFLFNTLETIDSYASRSNGDAVSSMVLSLSRMMRHTVSNNSGWTTVREEMEYIHNFMEIHYFRHSQHVSAQFDIAEEALQARIMKLSIQPYIENAFKYGWSPNMTLDQFQLLVRVTMDDHYLHITISDTGVGMNEEILERIQALIDNKGITNDPFFRRHTGIYNAFRRFILTYGEHARFHISSSSGQGTIVEMSIARQQT